MSKTGKARSAAAAAAAYDHFPCTATQGMGRRQALIGALRREDAAVKEVKRLEAELEGMRGLLKVGGRAVCGGRWAGSWAHWSPANCE